MTTIATACGSTTDGNVTRLVALDLDGTTLNNHHELSERTIDILKRICTEKLATICIATGRGIPSVQSYLRQLQLDQPVTPIVCYNGAMGLLQASESSDLKIISSTPVSEDAARLLLDFANNLGHVTQYYDGPSGDVQVVPLNDEHRVLLGRYAALTGKEQVVLESYEGALLRSQAVKLLVLTNDVDNVIAQAALRLPQGMFHIIRGSPAPFFVEFLDPKISKGKCLEDICTHLGIPPSQVIAFGDGDNDKEMLRFAGMGFAMKNAQPQAKEHADAVLEWTNDEDGVARQLEAIFFPNP